MDKLLFIKDELKLSQLVSQNGNTGIQYSLPILELRILNTIPLGGHKMNSKNIYHEIEEFFSSIVGKISELQY